MSENEEIDHSLIQKNKPASLTVFLWVVAIISFFYIQGVSAVPFHPDESTRIYTSGDAELFWQQPSALFWREEKVGNDRQVYRELDAPLTNNFIALGRWVTNQPPLTKDWDWSKTWQYNQQAGALPSPSLLLTSRMAIAALFPFSIVLLFLTAYRIANEFTAWTSALLLASNALVLLQTRRAMAEGLLLFTTILTLWALVRVGKKRWMISIPAVLSFCAKQTLAPLMLIGLGASFWPVEDRFLKSKKNSLIQSALYGASMVAILIALHPFVWNQPVRAISAAIQARQALAAAQTADRPEQVLNTPGRKLVAMIGCLYLTSPALVEAGNYLAETRSADQAYLDNPLHSIGRSILGGTIFLIFNVFGISSGVLRAINEKDAARRRLVLLLAATLLQTLALYWLIPLPWQRYYLPLVPYACLWCAFGVDQLRQAIVSRIAK